ncbi:MAG: serine hydrolase [Bacteroidota bacterium]
MKNLIIALIISTLVFACGTSKAGEDIKSDLDWEKISTKVDQLVNDYIELGIFSGVVLIAEKGAPVYRKTFGLANRETNTPVTFETTFNLGSMNKSFTKVVIAKLIENGKLSLDDKLVDILAGYNQPMIDQVTISHLINHTSGFGDYAGPDYFSLDLEQRTMVTIAEFAKTMDLEFPPGDDQMYSNTGYILLGMIIEKISGKSYLQNVREYVIEPLGLANTYIENLANIPNRSVGYMKTLNGYIDNLDILSEPKPDGGFWGTADDVLTFYRAFFHGDQLVSKALREKMEFFVMIAPYYEQPQIGLPLAGGANGLNTVHVEMLYEQISIVVLANMDEPIAENIGIGALNIIRNREPETAQLPATLNVYKVYEEKGIDYLKANFEEASSNFHPADPKHWILNHLGYNLLNEDEQDKAIELFTLNTELFPEEANVWDSLAEAWLEQGDKSKAIENYKKALSVDPSLPSAKKMLKQLGVTNK